VVEQKRYQRLAGTKEIVIVSISTNVKGHNTSKALDRFWSNSIFACFFNMYLFLQSKHNAL
jgi:hypothetical protein